MPCQARGSRKGVHYFESWGIRFAMSDLYSQGTTGSMTFISIAAGAMGTEGACRKWGWICCKIFPFFLRAVSGRCRYLLWGDTMSAVHGRKIAFLLPLPSSGYCSLREFHMYTQRCLCMYEESTAVGFKKNFPHALQIQILFYVIYLISH